MTDIEKKPEIRITLDQLNGLKALFSAVRNAEINLQQAQINLAQARQVYENEATALGKALKIEHELFSIDRLTGVVSIAPGSLPGPGGMMGNRR